MTPTPRHPMPRPFALAALATLALAAACGSSNPPPRTDSAPPDTRDGPGRTGMRDSTVRRNTVVENNRPDVSARAGLIVVANQQGASATILDAATLKTVATVPVGQGPHEVAISTDGPSSRDTSTTGGTRLR